MPLVKISELPALLSPVGNEDGPVVSLGNTKKTKGIGAGVNVLNYIEMDGVTDDTAGWQAAVNAAANKVLIVPRKSTGSIISASVTITSPVAIISDGATIIPAIPNTVGGNAAPYIFNITSSDVTIKGLRVDGTTLVAAAGTLVGNRVVFYAHGTSGTPLTNIHIRDCWIKDIAQYAGVLPGSTAVWHGIYFSYVNDASIRDCEIARISGAGTYFESTNRTTIENNRLTDTGWYSTHYAADNHYSRIAHNVLDGESFTRSMWGGGIDIMSQAGTAVGNVTKDPNTHIEICHNQLSGIYNYGQALRLASCAYMSVHHNFFYNSRGNGPLPTTRTVLDGVTTATSSTVTSATAAFTASDRGALLTGAGITGGTIIYAVVDATTVTLSAPATVTAIGVSLTISENPDNNIIALATRTIPVTGGTATLDTASLILTSVSNAGNWFVGSYIAGTGITAGTTVTAVGATTITLSALPTIAGVGVSITGFYMNVVPHDIAIHDNVFVARGKLQRAVYAAATDIDTATFPTLVAPAGYNIRFEGNMLMSLDTSNYFSGVYFHGQDAGWTKIRILRNYIHAKGGPSQPTAGSIGLVGNANRVVAAGATNTNTTVTSINLNATAADVLSIITGGSIPAGSHIVSVTDANTVVISAPATTTATGVTLTIYRPIFTDVRILDNDMYCFGTQGTDTNMVGVGASAVSDLTIRFNRIENYFQGINTQANCATLRHIYENQFTNNVGDVQPNGLIPVSGFVRRTGMSLNPGGGNIAANTVISIGLPVTGAGVGEMVVLGPPATLNASLVVGNGVVTASNVVTVPILNPTGGSIATGTALWSATVFKAG